MKKLPMFVCKVSIHFVESAETDLLMPELRMMSEKAGDVLDIDIRRPVV